MNRIIRFRLSIIAVVLVIPMVLGSCAEGVPPMCYVVCLPGFLVHPLAYFICLEICPLDLYPENCTEYPDECVATWEEMQLTAIQICEEYPQECQEAFDSWVESLDEEASK